MHIEKLKNGETFSYRPHGSSMKPKINSGDLVTVAPVDVADVVVGDVVYCKVKGRVFLHLVTAVGDDGRFLISNNHGHDNGWTRNIYGRVVKVEA